MPQRRKPAHLAASHLIVAGTSLQVHPAAGLLAVARGAGIPVTLCNLDPTPLDGGCRLLRGPVEQTVPRLLQELAGASEG